MRPTFTIEIERHDVPEIGERWSAICSKIGLYVEEATAEEARRTALDLAPDMISHDLERQKITPSQRSVFMRIVDKIAIPIPASLAC